MRWFMVTGAWGKSRPGERRGVSPTWTRGETSRRAGASTLAGSAILRRGTATWGAGVTPMAGDPGDNNEVMREFNGFGQMTAEYQESAGAANTEPSLVVLYGYSSSGNKSNLESMT